MQWKFQRVWLLCSAVRSEYGVNEYAGYNVVQRAQTASRARGCGEIRSQRNDTCCKEAAAVEKFQTTIVFQAPERTTRDSLVRQYAMT
ncbi:hypothetical protein IG631_19228 [Alternaria alternata]|nr:hypothetical protein IG631_19228 [Alternaria alternata]